MADLKALNRRRGNIKAQITKLVNFKENLDKTEVQESIVKAKLYTLERIRKSFEELKVEYYEEADDAQMEEVDKSLLEMDEDLEQLEVGFQCSLIDFNKPTRREVAQNNNSGFESIKLPEIQLPKFSGRLEDWYAFKNQFKSIIDNQKSLSDNQKLYYLQSSLTGIAKTVQTQDDSYESLFKALTDRFENRRNIVFNHIQSILFADKIKFDSAKHLRILIDNILKHIRALKLLDLEMNNLAEALLINIIISKLDQESRKAFEMSVTTKEIPPWSNFVDFLQGRCLLLENINASQPNRSKMIGKDNSFFVKKSSVEIKTCKCNKNHLDLAECPKVNELSPKNRYSYVKQRGLCILCFDSHLIRECPLSSKIVCGKCGSKRHNSLLCFSNKSETERKNEYNSYSPNTQINAASRNCEVIARNSEVVAINSDAIANKPDDAHSFSVTSHFKGSKAVILSTARILVYDAYGKKIPCRVLIDNGSTNNYMSHKISQMLNLAPNPVNIKVSSINGLNQTIKRKYVAAISNESGSFKRALEFYFIPLIADLCPSECVDINALHLPKNIILADPQFFVPSKVDILLGVEVFFDILKADRFKLRDSELYLNDSQFGYIVSGCVQNSEKTSNCKSFFCGFVGEEENLNDSLKRFWELEGVDSDREKSNEEKICEEHFVKNTSRDSNGQYMVKIPFKQDPSCLGNSREIATKRLNSLWNRMSKDVNYLTLYKNFIKEYLELGHMSEVVEQGEPYPNFYAPHHGVYRPHKSSTSLRVVCNFSAPTTNGNSLNSIQLNGGTVQDDLLAIMLRFRVHRYAFTADIKQMFRRILVHPEQRNLQRILWKEEVDAPIKVYSLNTVSFGMLSSPFLACRTLKQIVLDEGAEFPLAASAITNDTYMDDILSGADNIETAKRLQSELISILGRAKMSLHKWCANSPELALNDGEYAFNFTEETKALGILWKPEIDCFFFQVVLQEHSTLTKRAVLSTIARIFDFYGILGPIIAKAKIFMQRLWLIPLDWNDPLPSKEEEEWKSFTASLPVISQINVARQILLPDPILVELYGFSDSSELCYGAVVYLRTVNHSGQVCVNLVASKSRVAPIKKTTIPRLELCAAVLLSKLVKKIVTSLKMSFDNVHLFSDSMIVLCWIKKETQSLKTFVANRVTIVQELTSSYMWHHVASSDNPADLISRGLNPEKLLDNKLWFQGPDFVETGELPTREITEPVVDTKDFTSEMKEKIDTQCFFAQTNDIMVSLLRITNNYFKCLRVLSFLFRFVENCKAATKKSTGGLRTQELKKAEDFLISNVQTQEFAAELHDLKIKGMVSSKSKVKALCPFVDERGLLRVGGRLRHSSLKYDTKFPILLPAKNKVTYMILEHLHKRYLHCGPQALLQQCRVKFWPINGLNSCKKIVRQCIVCFKASPVPCTQLMGDLPKERVSVSNTFSITGMDFCGPFLIKYKNQRKGVYHKIYVCVFVCMSTKAVHFEIVTDLTAQAFIACLKRFFARRGKPTKLFSDNATNFLGSHSELKQLRELFRQSDNSLLTYMSEESIEWSFIPPRSPNFGGIWERGVGSFKYHLKRTIGMQKLDYEEFLTVTTQIEGILNSRPLTPLTSDIDDLNVLTPGHFLIGRQLNSIEEPDLTAINENRLKRWQRTTKLVQIIWKKWRENYLSHLQQRSKWQFAKNNAKVGDMVLIKSENLPPCNWPLGRIIKTYLGQDNLVRVVKIKTQNGSCKRPITKVCLLPLENE